MSESKLNMDDVRIFLEMIHKDGFLLWNGNNVFAISMQQVKYIQCNDKELIITYDYGNLTSSSFQQNHIEHCIRSYKKAYLKKIALEDKSEVLAEEIDKLREEIKQIKAKLGI